MTIALQERMRQLELQVSALSDQLQDFLRHTSKNASRRGRQPKFTMEPESHSADALGDNPDG